LTADTTVFAIGFALRRKTSAVRGGKVLPPWGCSGSFTIAACALHAGQVGSHSSSECLHGAGKTYVSQIGRPTQIKFSIAQEHAIEFDAAQFFRPREENWIRTSFTVLIGFTYSINIHLMYNKYFF